MSTANFQRINARNYYTIDTNEYYDAETGEYLDEWQEGCEVYQREDIDEDIREFGKSCGLYVPTSSNIPGKVVCMDFWEEVAGQSVKIEGGITINPGHYEGYTIDWNIRADGELLTDWNDLEDMAEYITEGLTWNWNPGLRKMNFAKVQRRVVAAIERMADKLDDFCQKACGHVLVCAGRFSNGEAVYVPADSLKGQIYTRIGA